MSGLSRSVDTDGDANWLAARMFPETYPGSAPRSHFILHNGEVLPIARSTIARKFAVCRSSGDSEDIDSFLSNVGAPSLSERYPILAYGANRNPATLNAKFTSRQPRRTRLGQYSIPVLRGSLLGADVVACRLHGQGYFYGELLVSDDLVAPTNIDVRVLLSDIDQLRDLNDSENIEQGMYSVSRVPNVRIAGLHKELTPLAYVTNARVWRSPDYGQPIGFSAISADDRRIPAMTSRELMEHVLDTSGLRKEVSRIAGLTNDSTLARELSKYLNGQWWYHFHTLEPPISGYTEILALVNNFMDDSSIDAHSHAHLTNLGLTLTNREAYNPNSSMRFNGA